MGAEELDIDPLEEQAFQRALMGEDDLGAVIRAHLYVEAKLIQWLEQAVIDISALNAMKLDYGRRINMAIALGLDPELGPPLKMLASIRNDLAHKLDFRLTKKQVDQLFNVCAQREKEIILRGFKRTAERIESGLPRDFKLVEPKDKFALIAIVLRSAIIISHHIYRTALQESDPKE